MAVLTNMEVILWSHGGTIHSLWIRLDGKWVYFGIRRNDYGDGGSDQKIPRKVRVCRVRASMIPYLVKQLACFFPLEDI